MTKKVSPSLLQKLLNFFRREQTSQPLASDRAVRSAAKQVAKQYEQDLKDLAKH